jgi:hypothetical protein
MTIFFSKKYNYQGWVLFLMNANFVPFLSSLVF